MSVASLGFVDVGVPAKTRLLDERDAWLARDISAPIVVEEPNSTGGLTYAMRAWPRSFDVLPMTRLWGASGVRGLGEPQTCFLALRQQLPDRVAWIAVDEPDFTRSPSAPMFEVPVGTGEMISEIRESLLNLWRTGAAIGSAAEATPPVVLDVPAALQQARSQAGLPVQDLAAMFGIKRRQFYNLVSGEQQPEHERQPRIERVVDAVNKVSEWVGGNSRSVRRLLLARLDGDSLYDAAVADDGVRLDAALERAFTAAAQNLALPRRVPPSSRSTQREAAAVRGYLRSTRDDPGLVSDE